ncbi:MAG TPA: hypothetical protein VLB90_09775 [Pseudomonadales bacterium]|nr:hypothetical protein [Pseudomonadales bacterium]
MEKLIYLLWKPENITDVDWHQQLSTRLISDLRKAGGQKFRLNLPDGDVAAAAFMRITDQTSLPDAFLSFWMSSATQRHSAEHILEKSVARIAGYSVCESEPLPNVLHPVTEGARCFGMNHIVFLQTPPRLTREAWLETWLESHTTIAIETQQNFGYRQNIVVRRLTDDAPPCDAIVEENFPPEAIADQDAFYRQGTPEQLAENQKRMFNSCVRFIDFDKMGRLPTSEYNYD